MSAPPHFSTEVGNPAAGENFQKLNDYLATLDIVTPQWCFITMKFTNPVSQFKYTHNLGFTPLDVLQTSLIGAGTVTWDYASFSATQIVLDVAGTVTASVPTIIRAFIGTFRRNQNA